MISISSIRRLVPSFLGLLALVTSRSAQDCSFPTVPGLRTLHQPDGTPVRLHFRGTALRYWYEDEAGFPVVETRDGFVYARRDASGGLAATDALVGPSDPGTLGLERHVVPARAPRGDASAVKQAAASGLEPGPRGVFRGGAGAVGNLVILLRFADHGPGGQNRVLPGDADVATIMNAVGGDPVLAPTGSVRDHYLETSYGQFTIDSTVVGWLDMPEDEADYANGNSGLTTRTWDLIVDGLNAADPLVNFADFDVDGDGWVDAITFLHSGYGAEWGGTDAYGTHYSDRMWSHKWTIPTWTSAEGVKVADYNISPGLWDTAGSDPGRIGVVCHELGHFFGLPDLYDTDGSSQGIGNWCLMAAGSWSFDGSQHFPSHMGAWAKMKLGWVAPERLLPGAHVAAQTETGPALYMIDSGYPAGEYLLIENREPVGFDATLPQGGLAIWHVDDGKGRFTWNNPNNDEGYPGLGGWPGNDAHYRVALLQADGDFDLEHGNNRGDSGDVWRAGFASTLNNATTPNTRAYQDGDVVSSLNAIQAIGAPGANVSFSYVNTAAPTITTAALPDVWVDLPYAQNLAATGGTLPRTWSEFRDAPTYTIADLGPQAFALGGVAQGFQADDDSWPVDLPFAFPYYETSFTRVHVTSNGCIDLAPLEPEAGNGAALLRALPRIAGLWDDLVTDGGLGQDVFVDTSIPGRARFRWNGETFDTGDPVRFAITLFEDGRIRFDYGTGNTNLTPTVGISRAHSGDVQFVGSHDGEPALTNANSLEFTLHGSQLPPGLALDANGLLSGTPTTPGLYAFRVRVIDALNRYDLRELTLRVRSRLEKVRRVP